MPMTMAGIMQKTPQSRRDNSRYVNLRNIKLTRTTYKTLKYTAQTYSPYDNNGRPKRDRPAIHTTMIETNGKQVVVECDCEDFWATWEVALNRKKAARIKHSNGEMPTEKNPRLRPGCCKHVFRLAQNLMDKGKIA